MCIDRESRNLMADAIDKFLSGGCDNWELDDVLFKVKTEDPMCLQIRRQVWFFYDDDRRYILNAVEALPQECVGILKRWTFILRTGERWGRIYKERSNTRPWLKFVMARLKPKPQFRSNPYWPFDNNASWESFRKSHQ